LQSVAGYQSRTKSGCALANFHKIGFQHSASKITDAPVFRRLQCGANQKEKAAKKKKPGVAGLS
jgi:hypothetical protein